MIRVVLALLTFVMPLAAVNEEVAIARDIIAPLIDPVKVATLRGDRPANQRLYKILYWLETARRTGLDPAAVIAEAQQVANYAGTPSAIADKAAIVWSRSKLDQWGCFTEAGMEKLRRGGSPEITKGEHSGDSIALDHVLPRAVVPELAARFYNLEAVPSRQNAAKSAKITTREVMLARRWHRDGLISDSGLDAVVAGATE